MSVLINLNDQAAMRQRIAETGKIRHSDLRYDNVLSDEEISNIPVETIFQWVQEKHIGIREFRKWVNSFSEEVFE